MFFRGKKGKWRTIRADYRDLPPSERQMRMHAAVDAHGCHSDRRGQ